jgi:hypothetical protein
MMIPKPKLNNYRGAINILLDSLASWEYAAELGTDPIIERNAQMRDLKRGEAAAYRKIRRLIRRQDLDLAKPSFYEQCCEGRVIQDTLKQEDYMADVRRARELDII